MLLIGVGALALALAGGAARTPYPIQTMLLPPPRVPLLDGQRLQVFCVTNETLNPIQYTIYWGDSQGRNYQINAGASIIHSSRYSGPPTVEFAQHDGPIEHVRNKGIRARIAMGPSTIVRSELFVRIFGRRHRPCFRIRPFRPLSRRNASP